MKINQPFPTLGTLVCLGATVRAPWASLFPAATPAPLAAGGEKATSAFLGLPDIRQAMGYGKDVPAAKVFGEFIELIDPGAIHDKRAAAAANVDRINHALMSREEIAAEKRKKAEADLALIDGLIRELGPRTQPVPDWLSNEAALMTQVLQSLGLKPGAAKEDILKAIAARRKSRLGTALQRLSVGTSAGSTARVMRGIAVDRFVALGAFLIPGWRLVPLSTNGSVDAGQLTGLARAKAANARDMAVEKARSKAAGRA